MTVTTEISAARDEPTEQSPLLQLPDEVNERSQAPAPDGFWSNPETFVLVLLLLVFLVSCGDQLMQNPATRIIESVVCYQYYEKVDPSKILIPRDIIGPGAVGGVAELWCKVDAVQSEVARLRGWQLTLNGIPGLVLAVPMGWAADRYGRKPITFIALFGNILGISWYSFITWFWQLFDIRLVWLSTVFVTIGGGETMIATMMYVILSDLSGPTRRAANFLRLAAFNLLAALVMPPVAAWLMRYTPWIPNLLGAGLMYLALLLYLFCPETLDYRHHSIPLRSRPDEETLSSADVPEPDEWATLSPHFKHARRLHARALKSVAFLTDDIRVLLLFPPFMLYVTYAVMPLLVLQYISKRYEITFAKATFVMTIRNAMVAVLYFFILPWLSTFVMEKYHLSSQRKDLYLWRISNLFLVVGLLLIGLSTNVSMVSLSLAIIALGTASAQLLRSFLTSLVPVHNVARVYSVINIIETVGIMAGGPLMAWLFKKGLALGGGLIGLPFFFAAVAGVAAGILSFLVGLRKGEDAHTAHDDGDEQ